MVTATLRRDGSSGFGNNHRSGVYSHQYLLRERISEEPFVASTCMVSSIT